MQFVILMAVVAMAANQAYGMQMTFCEPEECDCPMPNVSPVDFKPPTSGNTSCVCACGKKLGELCDVTDHCGKGTYCAAPQDISNMADKSKGICSDNCLNKKCPQFSKCVLDDEGNTICECQTYTCFHDETHDIPYQAELEGKIRVFASMCHMVRENCDRQKADPKAKLWKWESANIVPQAASRNQLSNGGQA